MRRILVAAAVLTTLLPVAGCGSGEPTIEPGALFLEYARSTDVRNDRFGTSGGSSEDRLANFASMGTPDQLAARLLRTYECGEEPANRCELNDRINRAATDFAGPGAKPLGRTLVVKHDDGRFELVTVYVVPRADGQARLIDGAGETYTGLEDFRAGNDVLTHDDTVLTLRNITSVPGEGEFVVVSGHTAPVWPWWAAGGSAVLLLAGLVSFVVRRRRAAHDLLLTPLEPLDGDNT